MTHATSPSPSQPADPAPSAGEAVEVELGAARAAVDERRRQVARRGRAAEELSAAEAARAETRSRLDDETADVERLEKLSLTRVWAGLRGDRDERLGAERAEQQAAEYRVAAAETRVAQARRELDAVDAGLVALGDAEERYRRALAAKERWVHDSGAPQATALADVAEQVGALRAEQVEIAEAQTAAEHAAGALAQASDVLRSADGWSTYDTFFGGDMLASMVKHDKLDRAAALLRAADGALAHLRVELGDLGETGVADVGVGGLTRTLDIWFDNMFTDWAVANRISEARQRVAGAGQAVDGVRARLADRERGVTGRLGELAARREALLH
ncbi:hypothetical protein [Isoptericola sp. BMS4]|uniref:hypothetical protein n=1 Tax=Isoptericola sp. BMS4 TaxID=2527875 RepID=UPI0014218A8D|nr:hypothetical protein [Isoptericola sp. BMS4]